MPRARSIPMSTWVSRPDKAEVGVKEINWMKIEESSDGSSGSVPLPVAGSSAGGFRGAPPPIVESEQTNQWTDFVKVDQLSVAETRDGRLYGTARWKSANKAIIFDQEILKAITTFLKTMDSANDKLRFMLKFSDTYPPRVLAVEFSDKRFKPIYSSAARGRVPKIIYQATAGSDLGDVGEVDNINTQ